MIRKLTTYITDNTEPCQNLAVEEFLTFHVKEGECILFLWQNQKTVVIGKNQNCWKECFVHELEEDGGHLVRRLSGGGAVFHDLGNLNFTFCVRKEDYDVNRQLQVILEAVRLLGLNAEKTGRNDVTVDGRKFSGNAFFESGGFCYHHGTLLLDVDKTEMSRYLNVSREKLRSKSVDSVRARVVNLRELSPAVTVELMQKNMLLAFQKVYGLSAHPFEEKRLDEKEIRRCQEKFASWEWKYGRRIPFQYQFGRRFGWGGLELELQVESGRIVAVNAYSDGMDQKFVSAIPTIWEGCRLDAAELAGQLEQLADGTELRRLMIWDIAALLREKL